MTKLLPALAIVLLILPAARAQQTPSPAAPGQAATVTLPVATFSGLENQLVEAAQKKDQAALQRLISEDCNLWTPAPPGEPMPSGDWIAGLMKDPPQTFRMRQLAVQVFGDTNVVSFVSSEGRKVKGKEQTTRHFVVDVWTKKGDGWQLAARYLSAAPHMRSTTAQPAIKY
ncbi:MAG TPA: nuclear transport factor 2 family protein [Terriglobales bacterium]|jgi:ketosteroid isomerase-like protein|nr:nuclear transport factor 2 family protein [Terriglobales bacterium]